MYLWLDDSEQVIEELFLSNLHMESQAAVLDTGFQHLSTVGEGPPISASMLYITYIGMCYVQVMNTHTMEGLL